MIKKIRNLPAWMRKGRKAAVGEAIGNIVKPLASKTSENKQTKSSKQGNLFEDNQKQANYDTEDLPMVTYDGKIHYLNEFCDIAMACDGLITKVEAREGDEMVGVAFDMEWSFNYETGPEKTSLIQVCLDLDECFLFHLPLIKKLPAALFPAFLNHPRVQLHGVNIKNDLRKLERDFPQVKSDFLVDKCIDLGVWYNEVSGSGGRWSMERLVLQTLRQRIDKSRNVRMSKWHVFPLNENQKKYAAIDVFVSRSVKFKLQ